MTEEIALTTGWIARHTPTGAGAGGCEAAVYAGNQGRFSVDLDFSLARVDDDPDAVVLELIGHIEGVTLAIRADSSAARPQF